MSKVAISKREHEKLLDYISFLTKNPNPCELRLCRAGSECCGCPERSEWDKKRECYGVDELLRIVILPSD